MIGDKPVRTRYHKVWDEKVRKISKGLTILNPAKGQWISPDGVLFIERMIPVRIVCTDEEIVKIADMTANYYKQLAIMYYEVSNNVVFRYYDKDADFRPKIH
jgi:hypothetical protein